MHLILVFFSAVFRAQPPGAPKPATPAATPKPAPPAAPATRGIPAASKPAAPANAPKPAAPASPKPATPAAAPKPAATAAPATVLTTDEQKAIYAIGLSVYRSLRPFALTPAELEFFKKGLTDAAAGKPAEKLDEWEPKIDELIRSRAAAVVSLEKAAGKTYVDKAAAAPGAVQTASGLVYRETTAGSGASPKATDMVKVHYRGTLIDGTEFDSSYRRNQPATFP